MKPFTRTTTAYILCIACLLTTHYQGFTQYNFRWQTDGTVNSAVISNNTLYIGGSFSYVGPYKGTMVAVDNSTGEWKDGWPVVNARVNSIIPDNAGGWYICGSFTQIGGINRTGIAHLLPDQTVDQSWNARVTGGVQCMFLSGGILYIGGQFSTAGNQPRNNIAALDASANATSWNPNANGAVRAMAIGGSTIYAGGAFTTIGGQARSRLASITLAGAVTAWDPNVIHGGSTPSIITLAVNGNTVYAGGFFTSIGGQSRNSIAALDATVNTNNALAWNPNSNGSVECLLLEGNTIYVGGFFTNIGGQLRRRLAQLDLTLNTNNAMAWDPNPNGAVLELYKVGNTMYAGGQFTAIGGQTRRKLAALDITVNTNNATAWDPNTGNGWELYTIIQVGSTILAGGSFTSVNGEYRNNIAAIDLANNLLLPWNPNANGAIHVIKVDDNTVYAGGDFTSIGGQARNRIAALDALANTNNALSWNPGASSTVRAIAISGGTVYAGGDFTTIGGQVRNRIAALDAAGAATAWNPDANGTVRAIDISGSTVYAGGDFTSIGGQSRNRIVALDALSATNNALAWNPNANNVVRTIVVAIPEVYAGGDFTNIGGLTRNRIAALNASGNATAWAADANGAVRSLAVVNRVLYAAGDFNIISGQGRSNVASLSMDANTGNALAWNPLPGGTATLNTITVSGQHAYAGGSFMASASTISFFLSYMPSLELVLAANSIGFTAEKQDNHCVFRWASRDEIPGTKYEVQRSIGSAAFTSIAERSAIASLAANDYEITDVFSGPGIYRYRIKVTSPATGISYSATRLVNVISNVVIVPTMQTGGSIKIDASGDYIFSLYGAGGYLLLEENLKAGKNDITTSQMPAGVYYYAIRNKQGMLVQSGKVHFRGL